DAPVPRECRAAGAGKVPFTVSFDIPLPVGTLDCRLPDPQPACAAFYGINRATDDSGQNTGAATCSPRDCVFGGPADPCVCNVPNITSGTSGGNAATGGPFGGSCRLPNRLCEAGLSCNNGICDDRFGRCPF